jgi:hypothetical protein
LDNEENVLETITEILSELLKDEVNAFLHWKKRCAWVPDDHGGVYPNQLNAKPLWYRSA